jgi:hypothetical protein
MSRSCLSKHSALLHPAFDKLRPNGEVDPLQALVPYLPTLACTVRVEP